MDPSKITASYVSGIEAKLAAAQAEIEGLKNQADVEYNALMDVLESRTAEWEKREESLVWAATHDHLTGVYNKEHIGKLAIQYGQEFGEYGLVNIDAINFGQINKKHNIIAGDAAICAIADRLIKVFRPEDAIGRYGGDEFWVLLPRMTKKIKKNIEIRLEENVNGPLTVDQMRGYLSRFYENSDEFDLKDGCTQLDIRIRYSIKRAEPGESLMKFVLRAEADQKVNREREKTVGLTTLNRRSTDGQ